MQYEIRLAKINDATLIAQLFVNNTNDSYITAEEVFYSRATLDKGWNVNLYDVVLQELASAINNTNYIVLVVMHNEQIVGYTLTAIKPGNSAELEDFVIHKEFRKHGLGKKLYEKTVDLCKSLKIDSLFLDVGIQNKVMLNFCKALDLQPVSTKYYKALNK